MERIKKQNPISENQKTCTLTQLNQNNRGAFVEDVTLWCGEYQHCSWKLRLFWFSPFFFFYVSMLKKMGETIVQYVIVRGDLGWPIGALIGKFDG